MITFNGSLLNTINMYLMSRTDRQHITAIRTAGKIGFNSSFIFVRDRDGYANGFANWKFNNEHPFEYHQ